jgi:hypothetical protein
VPEQPRSVATLAEEIRTVAHVPGARHVVEARLREVELDEQERVALVIDLLRTPDAVDPHPADLAVCAFVAMGHGDFTMPPEPAIDLRTRLLDLRARLLDLRETDRPTS